MGGNRSNVLVFCGLALSDGESPPLLRNRKFADSPLGGGGFELPVPLWEKRPCAGAPSDSRDFLKSGAARSQAEPSSRRTKADDDRCGPPPTPMWPGDSPHW